MRRLAVIFPGLGYTADKPLLYYSAKIARSQGYEVTALSWHGLSKKAKGDADKLRKACRRAAEQASEQLAEEDLTGYEDVVFVGKSVGAAAAAALAADSPARERIRLVLFTPLEETFAFPLGEAVAFTGAADPWVGGEDSRIGELCARRDIPCHIFPGANHSLETGDPLRDVEALREAVSEVDAFFRREQVRRIGRYEALFREAGNVLARTDADAAALLSIRPKLEALAAYYESDDWKRDFTDDEAGRIPKDLPRGVLSEDGIYDLLETYREQ